jgi:hypothetical protein
VPTQKAEPFRGSFMLIVDSKTRKVDVDKLRREIGAFLATRRTPRGSGACTTIQGPGNVVICDGGCTKPGFSCEPKKQANGSWKCVCQKPIMKPFKAKRTAARSAKAR